MAGFWTDMEAAILAWAQGPLPTGHALWANQRLERHARPYLTLKRGGVRRLGGVGDELHCLDNGAGGTHAVVGRGEFTVSVQVFASAVVGDAQATITSASGERTAADYLQELQLALSKPSVLAAFSAAGLATIDPGVIRDLPDDSAGTFMSRAQMDVTFSYVRQLTETAYVIERVQGEVDVHEEWPARAAAAEVSAQAYQQWSAGAAVGGSWSAVGRLEAWVEVNGEELVAQIDWRNFQTGVEESVGVDPLEHGAELDLGELFADPGLDGATLTVACSGPMPVQEPLVVYFLIQMRGAEQTALPFDAHP